MTSKKPSSAHIKNTIVKVLKDHKAINVLALNIKPLTDIATYMIIASANSTTHVKTLIEKSCEKLAAINLKPIGIEGANTREWMLVDFGDIILHVMLENIRNFYNLEKLWGINKIKITSKEKSH